MSSFERMAPDQIARLTLAITATAEVLGRGCIPRFGEGNAYPFGGYPAVSLIARS